MPKIPDIPTELLHDIIVDLTPVPAYGLINIIAHWLKKKSISEPPPEKLQAWSHLGTSAWIQHKDVLIPALNEFKQAFLPLWIRKGAIINMRIRDLEKARVVSKSMLQAKNKKKPAVIRQDAQHMEIGRVFDNEPHRMPDTIDAKSRKTALLRKKKGGNLPDFSD